MFAHIAALVLFHPVPADRYRFVLYGDCRDGHAIHRKLVALTMEQKPAFVIQTGDLVHKGTVDDQWKIYDEITAPIRDKITIYPCAGNHDFGGTGYAARMTAPIDSDNKMYYSFNRGRWHFISLAVDENTPYGPKSEQYAWFVSDLKKAHDAKRDIAVYFHVPPYSIGGHGSDLEVRATLCPLFEKYGVALVLNGHDHNYYRTVRNGITYIVSGGGGAPLYPCFPEAKGAIAGDKWISANHIIVFDVDGDHAKATVLRADGSPFDEFEVNGKR